MTEVTKRKSSESLETYKKYQRSKKMKIECRPFYLDTITDMDRLVPESLKEIYTASFGVQRYKVDYYPDAISDWTGCHLNRCRMVARTMDLPPGVNREKLELILLLHDLPEVGETKDVTGVDKMANPALAQATDIKEGNKARSWFSPEQMSLYTDFEGAKRYLKAGDNMSFSPEALIARLIEQTDGNMVFHYLWSEWAQGNNWRADFVMPEMAALYTFRQFDGFKGRLLEYPNAEVRSCGIDVLNRQIDFVKKCWQGVRKNFPERLPEILVNEIGK